MLNQKRRHQTFRSNFAGDLFFESEDARNLSYPNNWFDLVTAISTIEHIEEDSKAMEEIGRVLKEGGTAFLTLPFSIDGYSKLFRDRSSYTSTYEGKPCFFEHEYDEEALATRIIEPSDLVLKDLRYVGEPGWSYRTFFISYVPLRNAMKYIFGWSNRILSENFLNVVEEKNKAQIVAVALTKK